MFDIDKMIELSTLEATLVEAQKNVLSQLDVACEFTRKASNHEPVSLETLYSEKDALPLVQKQWEDLETFFTTFRSSMEELSSYVVNESADMRKNLLLSVKWMQDNKANLGRASSVSTKLVSPRLFNAYTTKMESLCKSITRREYKAIPSRLSDLNCTVADGNVQRLPEYYALEKTQNNRFLTSPYNWSFELLNNTTNAFCRLLSSIENMNRVLGAYAQNTTQQALQNIYIAKGRPMMKKNLELQPMIGEAAQSLGLLYNASIVEQYYADNLSLQLYNAYLNLKSYSVNNKN